MLSLSLENSDKSEKQVYCCALNSDGVIAAGNIIKTKCKNSSLVVLCYFFIEWMKLVVCLFVC